MRKRPFSYRPDVDGLRAVAIAAVVAFHAFPGAVRGGFTGVDVFFVISGYLISHIIWRRLDEGRFSLAWFYGRRALRLFPALALVLVATLVTGRWLLLPDAYETLGKDVASAAAFVSNLVLWHDAGYFTENAALRPLTHLWSLAVEEQFYLVFPLLLLLTRRSWRLTGGVLALLLAGSFAWNVHIAGADPAQAFYLLPSRFWELLLGGVLAYVQLSGAARRRPRLADGASLAGLALLPIAFLGPTSSSVFPGWWALAPTAAAVLLIAAGPSAVVNRRFLAAAPVVLLGKISYPLYLWHFPLLVLRAPSMGAVAVAPAHAGRGRRQRRARLCDLPADRAARTLARGEPWLAACRGRRAARCSCLCRDRRLPRGRPAGTAAGRDPAPDDRPLRPPRRLPREPLLPPAWAWPGRLQARMRRPRQWQAAAPVGRFPRRPPLPGTEDGRARTELQDRPVHDQRLPAAPRSPLAPSAEVSCGQRGRARQGPRAAAGQRRPVCTLGGVRRRPWRPHPHHHRATQVRCRASRRRRSVAELAAGPAADALQRGQAPQARALPDADEAAAHRASRPGSTGSCGSSRSALARRTWRRSMCSATTTAAWPVSRTPSTSSRSGIQATSPPWDRTTSSTRSPTNSCAASSRAYGQAAGSSTRAGLR